ncbi:MAG: aminomethyl-transferring glycine dehydrogenase subunit GcvPA [Firmicutes bacterium]|nr:aminomethyl-transferring glycine dehydrogenase subunit GcvPA [Bacillota bacterium]
MLETIGVGSVDELFADIPESVRLHGPLNLPTAQGEWEMLQELRSLAGRNTAAEDAICLLGAGAYKHFIPEVVAAVIGRSEFYTSYTPYQPEISQGVLQAIFEYQTMVCELLDLDVANASVYDGATALGEAAMMACGHTRRNQVLVSAAVHPEYRAVLATYARGQRAGVVPIACAQGRTDIDAISDAQLEQAAAVVIQYPNFFGVIEDVRALAERVHAHGALLVASVNPIAVGLLEAPGALGVDIAVAEGQPLGNALSFGGPYLGVIAARADLVRRLPGRIVGQTRDREGRRGFVLTLQAREQHIRREKASSNICSNQALNALAASVYLSAVGPMGLERVARTCVHRARYARAAFVRAGARLVHEGPHFHEFVLDLGAAADRVCAEMERARVLFGYRLDRDYEQLQGCVLLACTEVVTVEQIDAVAKRLEALL